MIDSDSCCSVEQYSSVYESKPCGLSNQNNFYNAVVLVRTFYQPFELFRFLKKIEIDMGRKNSVKWGPRLIDLDILFFNDIIYSIDELTIPHKECMNRDFVLEPLLEISPDIVHPGSNQKISEFSILNSGRHIIRKIQKKHPVE